MFQIEKEVGSIAGKDISLESGFLCRQAGGSVLLKIGRTQLLAVATMSSEDIDRGFFPLTVDYIEKFYSVGRIPGSYNRREGKPTDHEVLVSRLIDRPLRPLFPTALQREVQVIVTVLSLDVDNPPDAVAGLAASAALMLSDIPFDKPIGSARVAMDEKGEFVLNPSLAVAEASRLNLLISGTEDAITMIEGEAGEIDEETMLAAIEYTQAFIKKMIVLQKNLASKAGKVKMTLEAGAAEPIEEQEKENLRKSFENTISDAILIKEKKQREKALKDIHHRAEQELMEKGLDDSQIKKIISVLHDLEAELIRKLIVTKRKRNDGRAMDEIRPLDCRVDMLENAHGSAVFTRGETQALAAVSLGSERDQQKVDLARGTLTKPFMLHYNFPPFSVGEVGRLGSTGRREIGHGMLAERSIARVLPSHKDFDFAIRVVSEVLESNGSSSMATVCATSLALMSAGVPIRSHVAGVAMGMIMDGDAFVVLTDIAGVEDHHGDMDFKVAGTRKGITGFQLDIKVDGVTIDVMRQALAQAKDGRMKILDKMEKVISEPNSMSKKAPRREKITIKVDRIKSLIGIGGRNIRQIVDETGSEVTVNDDGIVTIFSKDEEQLEKTKNMIELSVGQPKIGSIYEGKVKRVTPFGVFVEIIPGLDGLCHISNYAKERVEDMFEVVSEGDVLKVRVENVDDQGRISLSRKVLL